MRAHAVGIVLGVGLATAGCYESHPRTDAPCPLGGVRRLDVGRFSGGCRFPGLGVELDLPLPPSPEMFDDGVETEIIPLGGCVWHVRAVGRLPGSVATFEGTIDASSGRVAGEFLLSEERSRGPRCEMNVDLAERR